MRLSQVTYPGTDLNYANATRLAESLVREDDEIIEPVLIASHDRKSCSVTPFIEGVNLPAYWLDHGTKLRSLPYASLRRIP